MRRKVIKMKSSAKSKIIILITLGIIFALSPIINSNLIFSAVNSDNGNDVINLDNNNLRSSKVSGRIHINGNSGWSSAKTAGICTGDGTYSEPYVIEDFVIDGGGSESCILIENSNVYFRIENCTVYNSGGITPYWGYAGIRLNNTKNGNLNYNNCSSNNFFGILLFYGNNNTISGNTANNNIYIGIHLLNSDNNTISGNTANNNPDSGINLGETDDTIVSGNLVLNNGAGIFLDDSNYIRILNNTVNHNNASGIGLGNTNNNGQLINNNCSFNGEGITFESNCENNTVQGNIINSNTEYGINLMVSSNNDIEENIVNNNGNMGINLDPRSSYNEIVNNTVNFNGWLGIHMQANSTHNLILSNNCSFNNQGISVRTPNNTISGNYVVNNSGYGIHLWNSDSGPNAISNNITRNFVKYNNYGILLAGASALNIIKGNQIIDNTGTGVMISAGCFDNLLFNNTFINNIYANAEDNGNNNNWNSSTLGNYWDDYSGADANDDGIGDTPYDIPGTASAQDNFPIWDDGPEFEIPGYNLILLLGILSVVAITLIKKLKKY